LSQETSHEQTLIVLGPLGRSRLHRRLRGSSFRKLAHGIQAPLLYVKDNPERLGHILVCLGGLGYAHSAEQWALHLASRAGARLTLLHVVEPISYAYPTAMEIQDRPGEILKTDTPQGENLRTALEQADLARIETTFRERRGDIIHEIATEIAQGDYDLIAMGSPESSTSLRHRFKPNVTTTIAESTSLPVLAVRQSQDPSTA
jgi:nucleotide-binding universal stress UspA family protein